MPTQTTGVVPNAYYVVAWNGLGASSGTTPSITDHNIVVNTTAAYAIRACFQFEPLIPGGGPYDIAIFINGTKQPDHNLTQFQDVEVVLQSVVSLTSGDVVDIRITDTFAGGHNNAFSVPHGGSFTVSTI